ncbi:MAG TPA: hypothetical protein VMB81_32540 [Candidatus Sulfotelmatobacter sp.]|nr:hypothetical protein [Candidatus Sulfotelmatobacter sp.]
MRRLLFRARVRAATLRWLWALPLVGALALLGHALMAAPPVIGTTVAIVDATNPQAPNQAGVDASGNLKVNCTTGCSAGSGTGANNSDGVAAVSTGLGSSVSYGYLWNGATWDRQPGSAGNGTTVNLAKVGGTALALGQTTMAGSLPVALASNQSNLPTNTAQVNATTVLTGAGATGTGSQRMTVAQDGTTVAGSSSLPAGTNIVGKAGIDQTTPGTTNGVAIAPSANAGVGITPVVSTAAEATHVLKASAGNLYGVYATNLTATAGFLVVLNATSAPADGAITPLACVPLPANSFGSINYAPGPPAVYATGIVAVVTSAASCFTKTTGTITAFIGGAVQ